MPKDTRRPSNPDRTPWENHARRSGTLLLISGITTITCTFTASISVALLHPQIMRGETRHFATIAALALIALGAVLAGAGIAERLQRPVRWVGWRNLQHGERAAAAIDGIAAMHGEIRDRLDELEERQGRLEDAIKSLPDYTQGLAEGARVAAQFLGVEKD